MPPRPRRTLPPDVRRPGAATGAHVLVEAVLDALPSPTLLIDREGTVLLANTAWVQAAQVLDDDRFRVGVGGDYFAMALQVRDDESTRALIEQVRALSRGEAESASADYPVHHESGTLWYHLQAARVDEAGNIVVTHTDVTSRVRAERASAWQARHDGLTGLPNRSHLHEMIDAELHRDDRAPLAVLFLDVDGFKDVNDSLGHEVGDELLRELADRLRRATRHQDAVARLGGDEFVVLCRECDAEGAELLARRCQEVVAEPFWLGGRPIRLGVSIGIATADRGALRATELVRDADLAMYAAKAAGRNRVRVFTADLRSSVQQRMELAGQLREAIEGDQLVLHYQPVMELATGRITGAEALVRWQHPERGLLPPCDFVPLAEQHDLIVDLTRWVLTEACRQTAEWARQGQAVVTGVNVTAGHLMTGTLVDDVVHALDAAGLEPQQLVVELTETTAAEDPARAAAQFTRLRELGVESSIDDFGSGFSSLSQLVSIPAGVLKIDRTLVNGVEDRDSQSAAAVAAVVGLAEACGMRSLAEGVETAAQLQRVVDLGCWYAQGFHIARPMPGDEMVRWLTSHQPARVPAGTR